LSATTGVRPKQPKALVSASQVAGQARGLRTRVSPARRSALPSLNAALDGGRVVVAGRRAAPGTYFGYLRSFTRLVLFAAHRDDLGTIPDACVEAFDTHAQTRVAYMGKHSDVSRTTSRPPDHRPAKPVSPELIAAVIPVVNNLLSATSTSDLTARTTELFPPPRLPPC
jgi:hypothetical protein